MPASAIDAPASFKNPRRDTGSSHSLAPFGNSRCNSCWNSGSPDSSCRLRQYSSPSEPASNSRAATKSFFPSFFVPGQTSSVDAFFASGSMCLCFSYFTNVLGERAHARSTVAGGTTRQIVNTAQVVLVLQVIAQRQLVGEDLAIHFDLVLAARLLVAHVEHLFARPQVLLRLTMAGQAPLHRQRLVRPCQRHGVHAPMATGTTHALVDVNAVVEIDVVRQVIHARPLQRSARAIAFPHRLQQRCV